MKFCSGNSLLSRPNTTKLDLRKLSRSSATRDRQYFRKDVFPDPLLPNIRKWELELFTAGPSCTTSREAPRSWPLLSSGSWKTSFLKYYLSRVAELRDSFRKSRFVVFGRDSKEFPEQNFTPLLQLGKIGIELLANKIVVLDDAGAYKTPKTKVEDLLQFG